MGGAWSLVGRGRASNLESGRTKIACYLSFLFFFLFFPFFSRL